MRKAVLLLAVLTVLAPARRSARARPARRSASSCSSSRARASPRWGTPAWRSATASSPSTTTRASSVDRRALPAVHPQRVDRRHRLRLRRGRLPRRRVWELLRQRDRAQLGRHRRPHGRQAAGHRRTLHASPTWRSASVSVAPITDRFAAGLQVNYVDGDDLAQLAEDVHPQRRDGLPADRPAAPARRLDIELRAEGAFRGPRPRDPVRQRPVGARRQQRPARRAVHRRVPRAGPLPRRGQLPVPDEPDEPAPAGGGRLPPQRQQREREPRRRVELEGHAASAPDTRTCS